MPNPELRLFREVDAYQQSLTIDVHDYEGFKVRVKAYDGKSPMPSLFELLPGGETAASCDSLYAQTVERFRADGWSETLPAESQARIAARVSAERAAEDARKADLARRLASFPASKQDRTLAAAIKNPTNVRELDLRADGAERLTVIPPSVKALKALEVLHAEGNGLPELPEELEKAKELRELHLAGNALTDVPPGVRSLKKLEVLDLLANRITRLFWKPKATARYELGGNPLLPAVQGSFTRSAIGHLPKLSYLGIDTDSLFPLDPAQLEIDFPGIRSFPLDTLVLHGRAPSESERAQLKGYFPKAKVEQRPSVDFRALPSVEQGNAKLGREDAEASTTKSEPKSAPAPKPRKPGPMHAEQAAHLAAITALAKKAKIAAKTIATVARPCAELFTKKPSAAAAKLGRSRLGGTPDLPVGVEWPRGERGPMQYVGQLDLAELEPFDPKRLLPKAGLLVFFAGHYDEGRVIHCPPGTQLIPRAQPKGAKFSAFDAKTSPACGLSVRGGVSLPAVEESVDSDAWHDLVVAHFRENEKDDPPHRVLGHTCGDVDDPPEGDHVLFAVRSDPNTSVEWGDYGTLYFMMTEEALRAQRWDELVVCSTT